MSVFKETGKVEKQTREISYEETHVEWKITDFFSIAEDNNQFQWHSPIFSFANTLWNLILLPKSKNNPGFMILYIWNRVLRQYPVEYNYGLKKLDGNVQRLFAGVLNGDEKWSKAYPIIQLSDVLRQRSELAPSDVLTITCTLKREMPQQNVLEKPKVKKLKKLDTLSENFKDLYANKESCDTTLHVGENEYKVHKVVLIARSSLFAAMFLHDMAEKQTGIVNILDCDPDSFEEFLKYLYCGELEELSCRNAIHLYETSEKYDVQELQSFCIEFLMENLTPENFCDVVIMADKYDETELFSAAQGFFNENLNKVFETSEWERFLKSNHRLANKLLKEMSKMKVSK